MLRQLVLSENVIEDDGAIALGESLKANTTLTELSLYECGIKAQGAKAIETSIKERRQVGRKRLDHVKA